MVKILTLGPLIKADEIALKSISFANLIVEFAFISSLVPGPDQPPRTAIGTTWQSSILVGNIFMNSKFLHPAHRRPDIKSMNAKE